MSHVSSSELADLLTVSRTRVGQYVREGKLAGCYTGAGRDRRFDLEKVALALGRQLHPGQMMGNGAATRAAIRTVVNTGQGEGQPVRLAGMDAFDDGDEAPIIPAKSLRDGGELGRADPDRYELARTQKAEEEAKRLRRMNAEAEGTYVLAAEVERQVAKILAQEIAEIESVLRNGARMVADKMGVDFKAVRLMLMDEWRSHRANRSADLQLLADEAELTAEERDGDI